MSITCGHCHHQHDTVSQVRACSTGTTTTAVMDRPTATNAPLASEKQRNFIRTLASERGLSSVAVEIFLEKASMSDASAKIKALLDTPKSTVIVEKVTMPKVPSGRYAVVIDGVTKFFKVDAPTEGQWAGRIFLKIQASDTDYPVRNVDTKKQVLSLIAQDPKEAMLRYGRELGHCGHCGRTLTNEESREAGIGPICRVKMGW